MTEGLLFTGGQCSVQQDDCMVYIINKSHGMIDRHIRKMIGNDKYYVITHSMVSDRRFASYQYVSKKLFEQSSIDPIEYIIKLHKNELARETHTAPM
jgi:hypothetical protein